MSSRQELDRRGKHLAHEMEHNLDIFLHIPKTGGMSLRMATRWVYGWRRVHTTPTERLEPEQVAASLEQPAQLRLVRGHLAYGLHEHISGPCRYFTMIREPVARVISLYYYVKRQWPNSEAASLTLGEYIESGHRSYMPNDQSRRLAGPPIPEDPSSPSLLKRARAHLRSPNFAFGVTERFDEGLVYLKRHLEWSRHPLYVRINSNDERPSKEDIPVRVRERIREQNRLDLQLYEEATKRFQENIEC